MTTKFIAELIVFVVILLSLNYFFKLHISIIGSVVLTLIFAFAFRGMRSRRSKGSGGSGGSGSSGSAGGSGGTGGSISAGSSGGPGA